MKSTVVDESFSSTTNVLFHRKIYLLLDKEACSKQNIEKYDNILQHKIGYLVMIKMLIKLKWDAKYIPNFRIIRLIGTRQLEVSNPTGRLRKVDICDVHKILPSDFIVSCIPDEQVFPEKASIQMIHVS